MSSSQSLPHHPMMARVGGGHFDPPHQARFERHLLSALTPSSLSRPISPNPSVTPTTPISPSPQIMHPIAHLPPYLTDVYKRRCLSDTDLSHDWDDRAMVAGHLAVRGHPHHMPLMAHGGHHVSYLMPRKGDSLESEASSTQVWFWNLNLIFWNLLFLQRKKSINRFRLYLKQFELQLRYKKFRLTSHLYGELHLNYLPTPNKKATLIKILN